jgi:cell division protein FtsW
LLYCIRKDYRRWDDPKYAFAALGLVVLLLVTVYIADPKSHRWLRIASFSLQPSELAKPALALFLSYFLSRRLGAINNKHTLLPLIVSVCAMAFFVAVADLGTAVVIVVTTVVVIYVAGLDYRYLAGTMAILVVLGGIFIAMKPYRLNRLLNFVDPNHTLLAKVDPGGRLLQYAHNTASTIDPTYQQTQAKIAVGSGGATGLGIMQGRQKMLYLPESHTDMIYAVVGEETGFVGCVLLLGGFMVILWRGIRLYWSAADDFGRYLALSVTVCVVVQAMINISVVLDLGPTKGIPLPFISYGGSSLMSTLLLMGMVLSVSEHAG